MLFDFQNTSSAKLLIVGGLAALALLVGAFLWGRSSVPVKVTETAKTETAKAAKAETTAAAAEQVAEHVEVQAAPVKRTTTVRKAPAAPPPVPGEPCPQVEETTVIEEIGPVATTIDRNTDSGTMATSTSESTATSKSESTKIVEAKPDLSVSMTAWWKPKADDLRLKPHEVDLVVEHRTGPVWLGIGVKAEVDRMTDLDGYMVGARLRAEF